MDPEGFIPVTLIASFHRVLALSTDIALLISAIKESNKLELVDGYKVRTKTNPTIWPINNNDSPINVDLLNIAPIYKENLASEPLTSIPPPPVPENSEVLSIISSIATTEKIQEENLENTIETQQQLQQQPVVSALTQQVN